MTAQGRGSRIARLWSVASIAGLVAGITPAALVTPALAQAQAPIPAVTPYFAVVSGDEVVLRCDASDVMYAVAKLSRGQILRVDGEDQTWARVAYPQGAAVFASPDEIKVEPGSKTATVTKPTRLKAINAGNVKGSWKPVLEMPLAAGEKVVLVDAQPIPDGRGGSFYKIEPPARARAYVAKTAIQKATQDQINAYTASQAAKPPETTAAPKPVASKPADAPKPDASKPVSLADPMNPPAAGGAKPTDQPGAKPAEQTTAAKPDQAKPTVIEQKPVPPPPPSPYEKLEAAFDAVRKQPPEQAEYGELMAEYQSALDKLEDAPQNRTVRRGLQMRLDWLKVQADLQSELRKFSQAQQNITQQDKALASKLAEVDRTRQYAIVGRLSASTIYDGKRLPRMYRIQAVGGPAPRTLGYLKPDEKLNIDAKLGQVVGVVGEGRVDPTLHCNIITPLRVDTLEAANLTPAPEAAPSGGTPPASTPPAAPAEPAKAAANGK